MNSSRQSRRGQRGTSFIETLENRRLLSASLQAGPILAPTRTAVTAVSAVAVSGVGIHAEVNQEFTAVVGRIAGLIRVPNSYTLKASIDWGDGTPESPGKFIRQADGAIAVIGNHTYSDVGLESITVTVMHVPPPLSDAPIILVGTIHSKANVIASPGGVTIEATAGTPFTGGVGFFASRLSDQTMVAVINWGDGQVSLGRILALPTADPIGGRFEVIGDHTYDQAGSYRVQVWVLDLAPAAAAPTATPVIASIISVADVLPDSLVANT